jgi:hypothetical protein
MAGTISTKVGNLEFEERTFDFTHSTLELRVIAEEQGQLLGSPLPAPICRRGPLPRHGECIT